MCFTAFRSRCLFAVFGLGAVVFTGLGRCGCCGCCGFHFRQFFGGNPAGLHTRRHDDVLSFLAGEIERLKNALVTDRLGALLLGPLGPANQIVGGAVGDVLDGLDFGLAKRHEHGGGDAGDVGDIVLDAQFAAPGIALRLQLFERFAGPGLDFLGRSLVEALNLGDFVEIDVGDLFDGCKAFRDQQLGDHLVDVESFHEHLRALGELLLAPLGFLLLR